MGVAYISCCYLMGVACIYFCSCSLRKRKGGYSSSSRGGGEKQSKGLRHFSQLVCEKVREKGITSYNEVTPICVAMATTTHMCTCMYA